MQKRVDMDRRYNPFLVFSTGVRNYNCRAKISCPETTPATAVSSITRVSEQVAKQRVTRVFYCSETLASW